MAEEKSKEQLAYEKTIERIKLLIKKDELALPTKVPATEVEGIIVDLFEEEYKEMREEVKRDIKNLLKSHTTMRSEIIKKERELVELTKNKNKEFVDAANKVFGRIDNLNTLLAGYAESLAAATGGGEGEIKSE